jgi:hypothetical protein
MAKKSVKRSWLKRQLAKPLEVRWAYPGSDLFDQWEMKFNSDANLAGIVMLSDRLRDYNYMVGFTWYGGDIEICAIRAGCRTWYDFEEAFEHYQTNEWRDGPDMREEYNFDARLSHCRKEARLVLKTLKKQFARLHVWHRSRPK